ncbi:hypothetical protein TNCT_276491 [Trichonephila clavata]|uniref:Uncharacterized protein n=1 Tax=Trichonephila clavata TaxID=2740835 RepID=A0A8X6J3U8_TRICU|nr:hypothetical protein TNCT_276491 [Trichonephila clavata]
MFISVCWKGTRSGTSQTVPDQEDTGPHQLHVIDIVPWKRNIDGACSVSYVLLNWNDCLSNDVDEVKMMGICVFLIGNCLTCSTPCSFPL